MAPRVYEDPSNPRAPRKPKKSTYPYFSQKVDLRKPIGPGGGGICRIRMFTQRGYFKPLPCPIYIEGLECDRAYCPFRHQKSDQEKERVKLIARRKLEAEEEAQNGNLSDPDASPPKEQSKAPKAKNGHGHLSDPDVSPPKEQSKAAKDKDIKASDDSHGDPVRSNREPRPPAPKSKSSKSKDHHHKSSKSAPDSRMTLKEKKQRELKLKSLDSKLQALEALKNKPKFVPYNQRNMTSKESSELQSTSSSNINVRGSSSSTTSFPQTKTDYHSKDVEMETQDNKPKTDGDKNVRKSFGTRTFLNSKYALMFEDSKTEPFKFKQPKETPSNPIPTASSAPVEDSESSEDDATQYELEGEFRAPGPGDSSDDDGDQLELECRKIFASYDNGKTNQNSKTNASSTKPRIKNPAQDEYVVPTKKIRVAPSAAAAAASAMASPKLVPKKKLPTPKEALAQRYLQLEDKKSNTSTQKPRISAVPNVSLYVNSKLKSCTNGEAVHSKTSSSAPTLARTVDKGSKRVAHTPKLPQSSTSSTGTTLSTPPKLTPSQLFKYSKIPSINRQGIIEKIWNELKLNPSLDPASLATLAFEYEEAIAGRTTNKGTYNNLCMNLVLRLRKEAKEAQTRDYEYHSASDDTSSTGSNVSRQSHLSVLAGAAGARNSWSIEKRVVPQIGPGNQLYTTLKNYLLTPEELSANGYPWNSPDQNANSVIREPNAFDKGKKKTHTKVPGPNYRICDRCSEVYEINPKTGLAVKEGDECIYHFGRSWKGGSYSCCNGGSDSVGCAFSPVHVPMSPSLITGFVSPIKEAGDESLMGKDPWDVVALDCEMVYTTWGSELARVTVVGADKAVLYDELVKPVHPILDYNTRFSGINEKDMEPVNTTILDVQAVFLTQLKKNSILIGHSLESDLYALKLKHDHVVDTSVLIPHKYGPPYKKALRTLSADCLGKIIQTGEGGHDSLEDAVSALEIVLWKINEDAKVGGSKGKKPTPPSPTTSPVGARGSSTASAPGIPKKPNDKYHYVKQ